MVFLLNRQLIVAITMVLIISEMTKYGNKISLDFKNK